MRLAEFPHLPVDAEHLAFEVEFQNLAGEAIHHRDAVFPDQQAAGQACVLDLANERSFLIKDLDAGILAIRDPELSFGIDGNSVCDAEFTRVCSSSTPGLDELARLVELQNSRIACRARVYVPAPGRYLRCARSQRRWAG